MALFDADTVLIPSGCERFSDYTGYASTFAWVGNHEDKTGRYTDGQAIYEPSENYITVDDCVITYVLAFVNTLKRDHCFVTLLQKKCFMM